MYNLLEYRRNCSETRNNFWFYSKDEATNFNNDIADTNDFKSFRYKTKSFKNTKNNEKTRLERNNSCAIKMLK